MKAAVLTRVLMLSAATPAMALSPFPFEDVNNNGMFDVGDKNLSAELKAGDGRGIYYTTRNSLVIPAGVSIIAKRDESVDLVADQNIIVNGNITTGSYGAVTLQTRFGDVVVGPRARINGMSRVNIYADQGSVSLGAGAQLSSTGSSGNLGSVQIHAVENLTFGPKVRVAAASGGVYLSASGDLAAEQGLILSTPTGNLIVWSEGAVTITKASIAADNITVSGAPLTLTQSRVRAPHGCDLQSEGTLPITTGTVLPSCAIY